MRAGSRGEGCSGRAQRHYGQASGDLVVPALLVRPLGPWIVCSCPSCIITKKEDGRGTLMLSNEGGEVLIVQNQQGSSKAAPFRAEAPLTSPLQSASPQRARSGQGRRPSGNWHWFGWIPHKPTWQAKQQYKACILLNDSKTKLSLHLIRWLVSYHEDDVSHLLNITQNSILLQPSANLFHINIPGILHAALHKKTPPFQQHFNLLRQSTCCFLNIFPSPMPQKTQ